MRALRSENIKPSSKCESTIPHLLWGIEAHDFALLLALDNRPTATKTRATIYYSIFEKQHSTHEKSPELRRSTTRRTLKHKLALDTTRRSETYSSFQMYGRSPELTKLGDAKDLHRYIHHIGKSGAPSCISSWLQWRSLQPLSTRIYRYSPKICYEHIEES